MTRRYGTPYDRRRSTAPPLHLQFLLILLSCGLSCEVHAQSDGSPAQGGRVAHLITFSRDASPREGDDDHRQSIFISVPKEVEGELHLRLFDPDVGNRYDEAKWEWNSGTRFRLLGGEFDTSPWLPGGDAAERGSTGEAASSAAKTEPSPQVIAEQEYRHDRLLDGLWVNFATFRPQQGRDEGDHWLFRFEAVGLDGNDGNVFDLAVSSDPRRNSIPPSVSLFSYMPTVHMRPSKNTYGEARFFVPTGQPRILVHNFDLDNASVRLLTPFRTLDKVSSSKSGAWVVDAIDLSPDEQGVTNALSLAASRHRINDATFYVTTPDDRPLRFQLPILLHHENQRPRISFDTTALEDCRTLVFDADGTVDTDGDDLSYFWDFGVGEGHGSPITFTFPKPGHYVGHLIVRDDSGVVGNARKAPVEVIINEPPVASMTSVDRSAPGEEVLFDGSASSDADGKILQYLWSFDDGGRASGARVSHVFSRPGIYEVQLQIRDDSRSPCALSTSKATVWINSPPVLIAGKNRRAAIDEVLSFTPERVYDADNADLAFTWDFGDGSVATGRKVTHAYTQPGRYRVTVTVDDGTGTTNERAEDGFEVWVNASPLPDAGPEQRVAAHDEVSFDASASRDPDGKIIRYHWAFGDGGEEEGERVVHSYKEPGVYTVTLTTQDDSGTSNDTAQATNQVVVNHPPIADPGKDQRVPGGLVHFDGTGSRDPDGEIIQYQWDFGDGHTGEGAKTTHVYGNPGNYTVTLGVTDDSQTASRSDRDTMEVMVNAAPVADPGLPLRGAPGEDIRFDAGASADPDGKIVSYHWWLGDGTTAKGAQVHHAYQKPGRYQVRLQVRDGSGFEEAADDAGVIATINEPPRPLVTPPPLIAPGDEVRLSAAGSFDPDGVTLSYRWDFNDGKPALVGAEVSRRYEAPGIYYATLTVDDGFGVANSSAQQRVPIRVNHRPVASPGADLLTCNNIVTFDATESADADGDPLTYRWDFGDGTRAEGVRVHHIYEQGGSYPALLMVDDSHGLANSRHEASRVVTINQAPQANAGEDMTVCAGDVAVFNGARSVDPKGGLLKYHWTFGDGAEGTGINPTRVYRKAGVYPVQLRVEDETGLPCGRATDRILLRVAESPIAEAGEDIEVCANHEVKLDGSKSRDQDGLVNSFSWNFGDGTQGGGPTPTHMYLNPGIYEVKLTVTGDQVGSCDNSDSDTLRIVVDAAPLARIEGPTAAAVGETLTFDGSGSVGNGHTIVDWSWDFGDGATGSGERVSHAYEKPGRYIVALGVRSDSDSECNTTSHRFSVAVNAAPTAVIAAPKTGAVYQELEFYGAGSSDKDGEISRFEWDFGDGTQAEGVQVRHRFGEPGEYQVTLAVVDDSGQGNDRTATSQGIRIDAPPEPAIAVPKVVCVGKDVDLDGSASEEIDSSLESPRWFLGDDVTLRGSRVDYRFPQTGTQDVTLEVADDSGLRGALGSASRRVLINAPPVVRAQFPVRACAGDSVPFSAAGSYDPEGAQISYQWQFGDGSEASGSEVEHPYASPGTYEVTLRVDDGTGVSCAVAEHKGSVLINAPPVARAGGAREALVGGANDALLLDAGASEDADGDPLVFRWVFGDGTVGEGIRVRHRYSVAGDYEVTLTVDDGSGTRCATARDRINIHAAAREEGAP